MTERGKYEREMWYYRRNGKIERAGCSALQGNLKQNNLFSYNFYICKPARAALSEE